MGTLPRSYLKEEHLKKRTLGFKYKIHSSKRIPDTIDSQICPLFKYVCYSEAESCK